MATLIVYSTAGCHLCEQAEALLCQLALETPLDWQTVDIATDAELVERYGVRIPVLVWQGSTIELGWPFDLQQLRHFIAAGI
ncbi:MAG: glutaredoxin family protein [Gammaproteobacteria bacterium]|jgi:glutaredoxin